MTQAFEPANRELRSGLDRRRGNALKHISGLSREEVLRCNCSCLAEIVRYHLAEPPTVRLDLIRADDRSVELTDWTFYRTTGATGHSFFIPVERGLEWLKDIKDQRIKDQRTDGEIPLAFLDTHRSRIEIRIKIEPDDEEGNLELERQRRSRMISKYVESVRNDILNYNQRLTEEMATVLEKRQNGLLRAQRELTATGLPLEHNPEHEEKAAQMRELETRLKSYLTGKPLPGSKCEMSDARTFIVHGHDDKSLLELKNYLQNTLGMLEPVVLREMPGRGRTLIEKFEEEADATPVVFVLLTPDDKIATEDDQIDKRQSRPNVIFEMGFFLGKLSRRSGRVILLHKGFLEIPSDISGIEYIDISHGIDAAGEKIRRELNSLGILHRHSSL